MFIEIFLSLADILEGSTGNLGFRVGAERRFLSGTREADEARQGRFFFFHACVVRLFSFTGVIR